MVIPCWNAEAWVARAIESVLRQDVANLELIVVDDGSSDRTLEVVKGFGESVRWEGGPNRGACAARNRGLALASAPWIVFLDADDYYEGDFLPAIRAEAEVLPADLLLGASRWLWPDGTSLVQQYPPGAETPEILRGWLGGKYVQTGAVLWRTGFLKSIGGWNERVLKSQDLELVLRALLQNARGVSVGACCCVWFDHDGPDRVSARRGVAHVASEVAFHEELLTLVPPDRKDLVLAMGRRFYDLAVQAFLAGHRDLGREAFARGRSLGFKGHLGSPLHRSAMLLIGLENYSRIRRTLLRCIRPGAKP